MIENIWSGKNKLYFLLLPLSLIYGGIVFLRRKFYQLGLLKSYKASVPVLVIGNLTVGGNGKTPLVIFLVQALKERGLNVGVVSRGYGGKCDHYPLILNQQTTAIEAGDEPVLIYQRTHVPVVVAPKRSEAVERLISNHKIDIIITDDGLQHYALQRDIEIVVIDGKRGFGNGWWLPAGPMRESSNRLSSVGFVVTNGALENPLKINHPNVFSMVLQPGHAINLLTGKSCLVTELSHVCAMAGIGYPTRFFLMLEQLGINLENCYAFSDHQHYTSDALNSLTSSEQTLLMTEKDAVKCKDFARENWWYLPIDAIISSELIKQVINQLDL